MNKFDDRITQLQHAISTLLGTHERPIARRNARTRVLTALRGVRATLDKNFPIIKVQKTRVRLKTAKARVARMRNSGWTDAFGGADLAKYAAAGVRVRSIEINHAAQGTDEQVIRIYYFIPEWAKAIGPNKPSELRAAKKSRKIRDAAVAADLLRRSS